MASRENTVQHITSIFDEHLSKGFCDDLFSAMYPSIKNLARHELMKLNPGQQLSPTLLVNECYVKLKLNDNYSFKSKRHFYNTVSRCMRFFVIDTIRQHHSLKRKGVETALQISQLAGDQDVSVDLLALDEALNQLQEIDDELAEIIHLKFFSGMTFAEIAEVFECSTSQIFNQWQVARSLLVNLLEDWQPA